MNAVRDHYTDGPLGPRVQAALENDGLGDGPIEREALAPLDEFHVRGLAATQELAEALAPAQGTTVLDIGSGLGGPARLLAAQYRCDVTGIDLSPEFVEVATMLSERTGLTAMTRFQAADALALPFVDAAFDHCWTQHVAMNIADRDRLYAEVHRVLKPGGRFAIHDVVAGNGDPLTFPVQWSTTPETSFLLTASELRQALAAAGFQELSFQDQSQPSLDWFIARQQVSAGGDPAPAIGLHTVMGERFGEMAANLVANLRSGRAGVVQAVFHAG